MTGTERQTAFYRAYLIDDRGLIPLTIAWATIVGLWLLVYLVSAVAPEAARVARHPPSPDPCIRDHKALASVSLAILRKREAIPHGRT
jgi:hypothetical protein